MVHFTIKLKIHGASEGVKCKTFYSTLKGLASKWYFSLPQGSIMSWKQFSESFLSRFQYNSVMQRSVTSLLSIKQKSDETLGKYVKRFNAANSEVIDPNENISLLAFKAGLSNETINLVLASSNVTMLNEAI